MSSRHKRKIGHRPKSSMKTEKSSNHTKPTWDSTINDLTVHKLSNDDMARRRAVRTSCSSETMGASVHKSKSHDISKLPPSRKYEERQEEMLRDMFASKGRLWSVLKRTDKTLSVVRNMFDSNGKVTPRYPAQPNVTRAPDASLPGSSRSSGRDESLSDSTIDKEEEEEDHRSLSDQEEEKSSASMPLKISPQRPVNDLTSVKSENSSKGTDQRVPERKGFRMLKVGDSHPCGDVFGTLEDEALQLAMPSVGRTQQQVEELKKLTDALTLELISTNQRYETLSHEFEDYRQKSESRISSLEKMVLRLATVLGPEICAQTELLLDLEESAPNSNLASDDEDPPSEPLCREDVLAQLEELQRQRDLAQARLQAIANL